MTISLALHLGLLGAVSLAGGAEAGAPDEAGPPPADEVTYVEVASARTGNPGGGDRPAAEAAPTSPAGGDPEPDPEPREAPAPEPDPAEAPPEPTTVPERPPSDVDLADPEVDSTRVPEPGALPTRPEPSLPTDPGEASGAPGTGAEAGGGAPGGSGGTGGGGGEAGSGGGGGGTFVAATVDERATLANRSELPALLRRYYPDDLRDAGISSDVVVQFVVGSQGQVEEGSVKVLRADEPGFESATRNALHEFRFDPARVDGEAVRMLLQMPITWSVP